MRALVALCSGQRCLPAVPQNLSRGRQRTYVLGPSSHLPSQGSAPSLDDCSVPALSPASLDRRRLGIGSTATGPCSGGVSAAANGQVACEKCRLSAPSSFRWPAEEPTWLWEAQQTASAARAENTQIRSERLVGAEMWLIDAVSPWLDRLWQAAQASHRKAVWCRGGRMDQAPFWLPFLGRVTWPWWWSPPCPWTEASPRAELTHLVLYGCFSPTA